MLSQASDVKLTAQWSAKTDIPINYYSNLPTSTSITDPPYATDAKAMNTTFASRAAADVSGLTCPGYELIGWTKGAGVGVLGQGDPMPSGFLAFGSMETVAATGNDYYGVWRRENHTLTFDGNGGSYTDAGGTQTQSVQPIETELTAILNSNPFTNEGHTFLGWSTTPVTSSKDNTAAKVNYADGDSYTMGSVNQILYAVWKTEQYTVKYNYNGGTDGSSAISKTVTVVYGESTTTLTSVTLAGYDLTSWKKTSGNLAKTDYAQGESFTMPAGNVEFEAVWTAKVAGITFNLNGGTTTGSSPSGTLGTLPGVSYNDVVTLPVEAGGTFGSPAVQVGMDPFGYDGYTFVGWNAVQPTSPMASSDATAPAGTMEVGSSGYTYTMKSVNSVTLYCGMESDSLHSEFCDESTRRCRNC